MDYLDELGFDTDAAPYRLAKELVDSDYELIDALVRIRKESGMTLSDVAKKTGSDAASLSRFERHMRDPHLSTIRAYAHAIGAQITHTVAPFHLNEVEADAVQIALENQIAEHAVSTVQSQAVWDSVLRGLSEPGIGTSDADMAAQWEPVDA